MGILSAVLCDSELLNYSRVALRSTQIVFGKKVTAILRKTPRIEA
jgi:hypothetical protein